MKSSQFNVLIPADGRMVLFNTLYGSISVLEPGEESDVSAILSGAEPEEHNYQLYAQLIAQRHIIQEEINEFSLLENRKQAGIDDPNTLDLIVLPTMNCNFRCVYCYEDHHASHMTPEISFALKKWLTNEIPLHKVVMLYWFGGEPLLEYDTVLSISRHVNSIARQCGTLPVLHITTNGYLLNAARSEELAHSGIRDFQITLDGPPKSHDALRVLKSGEGSFERVFQNVCDLAAIDSQIKITLRINFNHTNLNSIPELLEMFPIPLRHQLRVVFEPIFGDPALSAICNISQNTLSEKLAQLSETAAASGYDTVFGLSAVHPGKLVYCYAERRNQIIVNFDGNVFKCSVCDFRPENRVGKLGQDGIMHLNEKEMVKWTGGDLFAPKCRSCVYLPLCMGGCKKTRMDSESSKECALVATNASYILKQVAFGGVGGVLTRFEDENHSYQGEDHESHCETGFGVGCASTHEEEC